MNRLDRALRLYHDPHDLLVREHRYDDALGDGQPSAAKFVLNDGKLEIDLSPAEAAQIGRFLIWCAEKARRA